MWRTWNHKIPGIGPQSSFVYLPCHPYNTCFQWELVKRFYTGRSWEEVFWLMGTVNCFGMSLPLKKAPLSRGRPAAAAGCSLTPQHNLEVHYSNEVEPSILNQDRPRRLYSNENISAGIYSSSSGNHQGCPFFPRQKINISSIR